MDVSVVVPCYNAESYIDKCLGALLSQDYPSSRYEVILVDNNSTDRTREIAARYSGVKMLSETKQGSYAARNRGVAASTGSILAFCDSDCVPAADWVRNIAAALDPLRAGIVLGRLRYACDSMLLSILEAYEFQKTAFVTSSDTEEIYVGYAGNMAVTRKTFEAVGPFLEVQRGADTVVVRRAVDEFSCDVVRHCPDVSVRHLEITNAWRWYEKILIYGRSKRNYGRITRVRALTNTERLQVCRETIIQGRFSPGKTALFYCLLALEGLCFRLGHLVARIRPGDGE